MKRLSIAAVGLAFLAAGVLFLAGACGGGGPADLTNREITDEELSLMVLPQSELGPEYSDFQLDEDRSGFDQNAWDEEDAAQDTERFGIVRSYGTQYSSQDAPQAGKGLFSIDTDVVLHKGADGASGNLENGIEDSRRQVGMTTGGVTVRDIEGFAVEDTGEEAAGMVVTMSIEADQELTFYSTGVVFRQGRLIGSVAITSLDEEDMRDQASALARKFDERIMAVLRGELGRQSPVPTP